MAGIVLAASTTVTACSGAGHDALVDDPDLTKQAAIKQTLKYMKQTEASLPEGTALSAMSDHPDAVERSAPNSGSVSCNSSDGGSLETDPQLVYMGYFVTGVPEGQSAKYLKQIRQLWESWGWTSTKEPDDDSAAYASEDGYTLSLQTSVEGTISVTGETPCIAAENFTGSDEVPQQIDDTDS